MPGVDRFPLESADGTMLHAAIFPSVEPVAGLLIAHDFQSHAGWFEASGTGLFLAQQGFLTMVYDRRGSGRSAGRRGHAVRARSFLEDMDMAQKLLRHELAGRRVPEAPMHVLANGFGTRVALPYAMENPEAFASVILTCPSIHMSDKMQHSLRQRAKILTSPPEQRFDSPIDDEDLVTSPAWLDWLKQDEMSLRVCTASFLRASGRLATRMHQAIRKLALPMLVMTAAEDTLVRNEEIEKTFRKKYSGPLSMKPLPGEHYVDFTSAQAEYRATLLTWMLGGWSAP